MKILSSITVLILSTSFIVSCVTRKDNLESRLQRQDDRFQKSDDRRTDHASPFGQRMESFLDRADARHKESFDRMMKHD